MKTQDTILQIGNEAVSKYETTGGYPDIYIGTLLVALFIFFQIDVVWVWSFLALPLGLLMFLILGYIRKKIILPRLGHAHFTQYAKERRNGFIQYTLLLLIMPMYAVWITIDPTGIPSVNGVMCLNFGLIPRSFGEKVWYYFIAAFALAPMTIPYYRPDYQNILICTLMLSIFVLGTPWLTKHRKAMWEPWKIPKPKNLRQAMLVFSAAFAVEFILYTLCRRDVSTSFRGLVMMYLIFCIGIMISIFVMTLGFAYKSKRMHLYAGLIAINASLSNLVIGTKFDRSIFFLVPGIVILLSGIRILIQFINNNPIIEDSNFLEDKVLYDTK